MLATETPIRHLPPKFFLVIRVFKHDIIQNGYVVVMNNTIKKLCKKSCQANFDDPTLSPIAELLTGERQIF
jgi:hypothetical protein